MATDNPFAAAAGVADLTRLQNPGFSPSKASIDKAMAQSMNGVTMPELVSSDAYWDANHPFHESVKEQVRLMHEQAFPVNK